MADKPTLIAKTVNGADSQTGLPNYGVNLKHGDTAYVPVDNEDQYYIETHDANGNNTHGLIENKDQTSTVANDWALLPFTVHLPKGIAGTYQLKFPDSVRVFIGPNTDPENKVISEGTSIGTLLDSNGDATLYLEGVALDGAVKIDLKKQGVNAPLDTLNVNVFELDGPENVPNYSVYSYHAVGINPADSPPTGNRWSLPSKLDRVASAGEDIDSIDIHWGDGPHFGRADFKASPSYVWEYHVNVVNVDWFDPADGFKYGGAGADLPTSHFDAKSGTTIALKRFTSSVVFPKTAGIEYTAKVILSGPSNQRGVDQMRIGFIQTANDLTQRAAYSNDHILESNASRLDLPLLDYPLTEPGPWYETNDDPGTDGSPAATFFHPTADSRTKVIGSDDTPNVSVPLYYKQGQAIGAFDDGFLQYVNIHADFRTDISVSTADAAGAGVYTAVAYMTWSWESSGTCPGSA